MTVSFVDRARDRDGPQLHRLVGLDDEHVLSLLAGLHRGRRHDDRVRIGRQRHDDVDELAGPEPAVLVRERALDADRAGRRIDRRCRRSVMRPIDGVAFVVRRDAPRLSASPAPGTASDPAAALRECRTTRRSA